MRLMVICHWEDCDGEYDTQVNTRCPHCSERRELERQVRRALTYDTAHYTEVAHLLQISNTLTFIANELVNLRDK